MACFLPDDGGVLVSLPAGGVEHRDDSGKRLRGLRTAAPASALHFHAASGGVVALEPGPAARVVLYRGWDGAGGGAAGASVLPIAYAPTALDVCPDSFAVAVGGAGVVTVWTATAGGEWRWRAALETPDAECVSVALRSGTLALASATEARVVRLADPADAEAGAPRVQLEVAADNVLRPAHAGEWDEALGSLRDSALRLCRVDAAGSRLCDVELLLWRRASGESGSLARIMFCPEVGEQDAAPDRCVLATGSQALLYDITHSLLIARYEFKRQSELCFVDALMLYSVSAGAIEATPLRDSSLLRASAAFSEQSCSLKLPAPTLLCRRRLEGRVGGKCLAAAARRNAWGTGEVLAFYDDSDERSTVDLEVPELRRDLMLAVGGSGLQLHRLSWVSTMQLYSALIELHDEASAAQLDAQSDNFLFEAHMLLDTQLRQRAAPLANAERIGPVDGLSHSQFVLMLTRKLQDCCGKIAEEYLSTTPPDPLCAALYFAQAGDSIGEVVQKFHKCDSRQADHQLCDYLKLTVLGLGLCAASIEPALPYRSSTLTQQALAGEPSTLPANRSFRKAPCDAATGDKVLYHVGRFDPQSMASFILSAGMTFSAEIALQSLTDSALGADDQDEDLNALASCWLHLRRNADGDAEKAAEELATIPEKQCPRLLMRYRHILQSEFDQFNGGSCSVPLLELLRKRSPSILVSILWRLCLPTATGGQGSDIARAWAILCALLPEGDDMIFRDHFMEAMLVADRFAERDLSMRAVATRLCDSYLGRLERCVVALGVGNLDGWTALAETAPPAIPMVPGIDTARRETFFDAFERTHGGARDDDIISPARACLHKLESLLCDTHVTDAATQQECISRVMLRVGDGSTAGADAVFGARALRLICLVHGHGDATAEACRVVASRGASSADVQRFAAAHCTTAAHWKALLDALRQHSRPRYEEILRAASSALAPAEFCKLLPEEGRLASLLHLL